MKRFYGLTLIIFTLGFVSIRPSPTAKHPGAVSTKTSIRFNKSKEKFGFQKYDGFWEDKIVVGKYSSDNFVTSQKEYQKKTFDSLGTGKFKTIQPPACVHITKNIFIDEAEITNIDYQEYLFYVKRDSTEKNFNNAIPQLKVYDNNDSDYFTSPQYRFFPVVGLTYQQAKEYCKWRSHFVTKLYNREYKKAVSFKFRLPTELEWEFAASNGLNKWKYQYGVETVNTIFYRVNTKASEFLLDKILTTKTKEEITKDIIQMGIVNDIPFNVIRELPYFLQFGTPYYTYSFYRNDFGIYNMIGNVAEMVEEKGVVKGGSYKNRLSDSRIIDRRMIDTPTDDIGFRCICEVE